MKTGAAQPKADQPDTQLFTGTGCHQIKDRHDLFSRP